VLGRLDGGTFDGSFYSSGAFQIGDANKSNELRAIAEHYGTPAACIMFFDDGAVLGRQGWGLGLGVVGGRGWS
jgi:hypothetical protein